MQNKKTWIIIVIFLIFLYGMFGRYNPMGGIKNTAPNEFERLSNPN